MLDSCDDLLASFSGVSVGVGAHGASSTRSSFGESAAPLKTTTADSDLDPFGLGADITSQAGGFQSSQEVLVEDFFSTPAEPSELFRCCDYLVTDSRRSRIYPLLLRRHLVAKRHIRPMGLFYEQPERCYKWTVSEGSVKKRQRGNFFPRRASKAQ